MRRRVNLTLTEDEERALQLLTDPHSPQHQAFVRRAQRSANHPAMPTPGRPDAELIHQVLAIGLAHLEEEASAASYAAEAAERGEERRQVTAALRRRLAAKAAEQDAG